MGTVNVDLLGTLTIDEIYYFYEEPQVFRCINKFGQIFLGLLIDMDIREWFFLPISLSQLAQLKANKISIRECFLNSEERFVWKVVEEDKTCKANQLNTIDIMSEDLPDDDLYLEFEDEFMPVVDNNIVKQAVDEKRDIFDLSLLPLEKHYRELECQVLGEILVDMQLMLYSLALPKDYGSNNISNKIKEENKIVVTGTYAASFGIRAKSNELSDLYGETTLTKSIKCLSQILEAKDDKKVLKNILKEYNPRVTLRYKKLMECLNRENITFNISLASPNQYFYRTEFTNEDIKNNINYLNEEAENSIKLVVLEGNMVGVNIERNSFAFRTREGEMITGNISDDLKNFTYQVPNFMKICLEKKILLSDFTSEEKFKYTLLEVQEF